MDSKKRIGLSMVSVLGFTALLFTVAAPAAAADAGWKVRVSGVWADPDFRWEQVSELDERQSATTSSDLGFGLGLEYRLSDRLGIEAGVAWLEPEVNVSVEIPSVIEISESDSLGFNPITVALNIYLTPNSSVDVYVAPMIAYVRYDDLTLDLGMFCDPGMLCLFHFDVDDDLGWGAALGVDIPLGDRGWLLSASVGYLDTDIDVTDTDGDSEAFDFDPVTASVGVAYRF
jgi:outer membrane protein W